MHDSERLRELESRVASALTTAQSATDTRGNQLAAALQGAEARLQLLEGVEGRLAELDQALQEALKVGRGGRVPRMCHASMPV